MNLIVLVTVVYVLVAVAMIVLILLQRGSGAQAGTGFGGGASATVFGASGSANFLSRSTKWLAVVFFALSLGMAWYASRHGGRLMPVDNEDIGLMGRAEALAPPAAPAAAPAAEAGAAPEKEEVAEKPPEGESGG